MRQRRRLGLALSSAAAAGVASLAIATPALAADPNGANGTVKIDGPEYQLDNRNEPHVTCEFQVEFFNFDKDEPATLIFSAQPPSSSDFHEVGRLADQVVSDDEASGGAYTRDPDNVYKFSINTGAPDNDPYTLDLAGAYLHPKQGYHVKLTVDRQNHPGWTEKHKVFWVKPCTTSTESPTPTPTSSESESPSTPSSPGASLSGGAGGGNGENGGGSLPLTGVAATSTALTGLALIGGGAALMVLRRRRDKITFTS
ncbi:LPXTG cell wall anchor domain-containing protein [Micromonospora globispora]|uniref:LPXTG cell wall anchor domain-containing protein n=1 Tax=Micromonospora globispora TaxID=1450148 RepID=UPI000F5EBB2E|nr:LPXTG cell wall anchor domain-containing protein [Micromonospora globispora]RQW96831.1 hypothetical protein DKL51_12930 [Micromonospora globispora]